MRAVKGQNTGPEMVVRRIAHSMGYRFRLHRKDLPGKPDLVFPGTSQSDLCSRMLLASTRLPQGSPASEIKPGLLAP